HEGQAGGGPDRCRDRALSLRARAEFFDRRRDNARLAVGVDDLSHHQAALDAAVRQEAEEAVDAAPALRALNHRSIEPVISRKRGNKGAGIVAEAGDTRRIFAEDRLVAALEVAERRRIGRRESAAAQRGLAPDLWIV